MAHCNCDWCSAVRLNGAKSIYDFECARFVPADRTKFADARDYVLLESKVDREDECWPRPEPRAKSAVQKTEHELERRTIIVLSIPTTDQFYSNSYPSIERSECRRLKLVDDHVLKKYKMDCDHWPKPEPRTKPVVQDTKHELEYSNFGNSSIPRTLLFDSAVDLAAYEGFEGTDDQENYTTSREASRDEMID